jgi:sugar phosphate isomerase/epimerase
MALGSAAVNFACVSKPDTHIAPIGVQLYSVRNIIFDDFSTTINKIADMGYIGVEAWHGMPGNIDLKMAAQTIKDAGLKVFASHCDLPVAENRDVALRMADAFQCDRLVFWGGSREDRFSSQEQINKTIDIYNQISEDFKTQGIKFGVHNHSWEFEETESGIIPFFYYLDNLNKDIFFEIDTYWAKTAGYDPVQAIKKAGTRAPFLHIKDGPAQKGSDERKFTPAGMGAMDFPAIVKAGNNNIKWMIVEFDDYDKNIFEGLQGSYDFLTKNKLAKGNV